MAFLIPVVSSVASAIGSVFGAGTAAAGATAATAGSGFSLGTALTVGSTLIGTLGALQQGQAASDAAKYNAEVQRQQADQENQNAAARASEQATRTGRRSPPRERHRFRVASTQRAASRTS